MRHSKGRTCITEPHSHKYQHSHWQSKYVTRACLIVSVSQFSTLIEAYFDDIGKGRRLGFNTVALAWSFRFKKSQYQSGQGLVKQENPQIH